MYQTHMGCWSDWYVPVNTGLSCGTDTWCIGIDQCFEDEEEGEEEATVEEEEEDALEERGGRMKGWSWRKRRRRGGCVLRTGDSEQQ